MAGGVAALYGWEDILILAVGMWVHVILNAWVCYEPTGNPIWGELRLLGVIVPTAGLWMMLAAVVG